MQSVNIFDVDRPEGRLDVAQALGSTGLMMFVYDLDPGSSSSPYHYEYEEEWLLVVDGTLVLRASDGEHTLRRGDLVRFPPRTGRCAQGDESKRRGGEDTDVLELACAGGLGLSRQRQDRGLVGQRGGRADLQARHCGPVVGRRGRLARGHVTRASVRFATCRP